MERHAVLRGDGTQMLSMLLRRWSAPAAVAHGQTTRTRREELLRGGAARPMIGAGVPRRGNIASRESRACVPASTKADPRGQGDHAAPIMRRRLAGAVLVRYVAARPRPPSFVWTATCEMCAQMAAGE
jgi:hypothetical protein